MCLYVWFIGEQIGVSGMQSNCNNKRTNKSNYCGEYFWLKKNKRKPTLISMP